MTVATGTACPRSSLGTGDGVTLQPTAAGAELEALPHAPSSDAGSPASPGSSRGGSPHGATSAAAPPMPCGAMPAGHRPLASSTKRTKRRRKTKEDEGRRFAIPRPGSFPQQAAGEDVVAVADRQRLELAETLLRDHRRSNRQYRCRCRKVAFGILRPRTSASGLRTAICSMVRYWTLMPYLSPRLCSSSASCRALVIEIDRADHSRVDVLNRIGSTAGDKDWHHEPRHRGHVKERIQEPGAAGRCGNTARQMATVTWAMPRNGIGRATANVRRQGLGADRPGDGNDRLRPDS